MIVCFGGGKGLSSTVKALQLREKEFAAVVSTIDNGGSTGRLREEFGIPAVGDFRRVVDTLAGGPMAGAMESRYDGHALGNLALLHFVQQEGFAGGLQAYRQAMGVGVRVVPQFTRPCDLVARVGGEEVRGEVEVDHSRGEVEKLWLEPQLQPNPAIVELLEEADALVFGPGSLYTSILPHLLVDEVAAAVSRVHPRLLVVGICNDLPIVEGFSLSDYIREVEKFVEFDRILVQEPCRDVELDAKDGRVVAGDMALDGHLHNPKKLGEVLCRFV